MIFVPANGTVLAKPAPEESRRGGGIIYDEPELPFFEILAVSGDEDFWEVGDMVVSNSTGTKVVDGSSDMYLFKSENLVARRRA